MYRGELDARIKMADEKIKALKEDITLFCEECRPRITIEKTDQKGSGRAVMPRDTIPVEWSIRIGIIAYLLRSSLDHLVWQLVLDNKNTPDHRNEFPIFRPLWGEKPNVDRMLNGVDDRCKRKILAFSYDSNFNLSLLWNLKALCNIDKHRHAIVALSDLNRLSDDYRRRAELASEKGLRLPEVGRDDLDVEVCFQAEGNSSKKQWNPSGEVTGNLEACSAAVKGVINHILHCVPVSWPFLLGQRVG